MNEFRNSFLKLKSYCEEEHFLGWDPYDGLNSTFFQGLPIINNNKFFRLSWIQFFKRNPINFRKLVGIKKSYNPKGLGLFLIGYCNLYSFDPKDEYLVKIRSLSNKIISLQSKGYSGACWGYNFDWQARAFFQPKGTPTVVATSFIANALFKAYEITKDKKYYNVAVSSSKFVLEDLQRTYDHDGDFSLSYSPLDNTQVYNASLLGARLLAQTYSYTKEDRLYTEAKKAISYVCKAQAKNGSWSYGTLHFHQWIDNFHTGYNLECIYEYQKYTGDKDYIEQLIKGEKYYLENFFTEKGESKYYNKSLYPIDIHSPAQLIVTLSKVNKFEENIGLIEKVLKWTITNMQSSKGFFYYQLKKGMNSKIPYMRWAQAWMFYGYTYYLKETSEK